MPETMAAPPLAHSERRDVTEGAVSHSLREGENEAGDEEGAGYEDQEGAEEPTGKRGHGHTLPPTARSGPCSGSEGRSGLGNLRGVADAGHGADQLGVLPQLGAEAADVDVDGPRLAEIA